MIVLEQKLKKSWEKINISMFYQYFKDNKLHQIKSCISADVSVMVGLRFPPKPYLPNVNECMNNSLKSAG